MKKGSVAALISTTFLLVNLCWATNPEAAVQTSADGGVSVSDTVTSYKIILVGNLGLAEKPNQEVLDLLRERVSTAGSPSAVIFLGDNVPCCGFPDSATTRRTQVEAWFNPVFESLQGYHGQVFFLPGHTDWGKVEGDGLEALLREEKFIESHPGGAYRVLPDQGFPGPSVVELTDRLRLVFLNTQWWFAGSERPFGETEEYELEEDADFLLQLDDVIRQNRDYDLIVLGHHPLRSTGFRSGYFPLKYHLFPLTAVVEEAYLPLPLIGSAYPLYRRIIGESQDLAHPRYRALRRALDKIFFQHERLIYAAGHEQSLEYFDNGGQPLIVSGGGGEPGYVARNRGADFSTSSSGLVELEIYPDGRSNLVMLQASDHDENGEILFATEVFAPAPEAFDAGLPHSSSEQYPSYLDSTFVLAANPEYAAGPVKSFFFGSQNRRAWTTPVRVPVLDLGHEAGGLTPLYRGGGMQTISLRLIGADGVEYVLRSVDKDPSKTVPLELQGTVATDIVQDQISSIYPYGAFIIPRLADAVGIYHTNPRLFYVPDDPRLGNYRGTFGGQLMMLEERPDDDMSAFSSYGGSKNIISPSKLYENINEDNDDRVDQRAFARARLLDMLISDWDRHRDQWRWAEFESPDGSGKVFRPVPRDRDWAFNQMNGVFPSLAAYVMPKFQDFTEHYGLLKGLTFNGMEQDRRFTSMLTRSDWVEIADSIKMALTDAIIEEAIHAQPEEISEAFGEDFARILKIRRDRLPEIAVEYYDLYARVVDVVGSNKHERYEVRRLNDRDTEVKIFKTTRGGEVRGQIYQRTFHLGETEEIRLYGLDGSDQFDIRGAVSNGIRIIVVGGPGEDSFSDQSLVRGVRKKTVFYDTHHDTSVETGRESKVVLSDNPLINEYDSFEYQHDAAFPITFFGSNKDDGIYIGGGIQRIRNGFRKDPYASMQRVKANFAAKTRAFNIVYEGLFTSALWGWDFALDTRILAPNNIRNYYGLGNETRNDLDDAEYYQARLTQLTFSPAIEKNIERSLRLHIGPKLEITKIREDEDRFIFIGVPQEGISPTSFEDQWYTGLESALEINTTDNPFNPRHGFSWTTNASLNYGLRNSSLNYIEVGSHASLYVSPAFAPAITLAIRGGAGRNFGSFPFYRAQTLGGRENLRGYRSTRFAGRSSVYQNMELRAKLFNFSTYLALGEVGILGFLDNGRVWADGERSNVWHQGYGGGAWVELFNTFVLSGTMGFSDEDRTFTLKTGFFF